LTGDPIRKLFLAFPSFPLPARTALFSLLCLGATAPTELEHLGDTEADKQLEQSAPGPGIGQNSDNGVEAIRVHVALLTEKDNG
jgi:hypothetical protein